MTDMHVMYAHECTWTFRRSCCIEDGCIKDMGMTFGKDIYIQYIYSQITTTTRDLEHFYLENGIEKT